MVSKIDSQQLFNLLYGNPLESQAYSNLKFLKGQYLKQLSLLKKSPNQFSHYIEEQTDQVVTLIQLHKENKIDLLQSIPLINELAQFSDALEIHFNLFRNICFAFTDPSSIETLKKIIDDIQILGSVLLHEFDVKECQRENSISVIKKKKCADISYRLS